VRAIPSWGIARQRTAIDRVPTVHHLPGLLVIRLLNDSRGRRGRCISESRCIVPPRVSLCREAILMHLASDYIHSYKDAGGRPAHCRVRIYLPRTFTTCQ
jgi:hypothetical protein